MNTKSLVLSSVLLVSLFGCSNGSDSAGSQTTVSEQAWQGEDLTVMNVRNDKTGNWRIATTASSEPQDQYAYEYYQRYMKNDPEITSLFIVNFTLGTTTQIFVGGPTIDVSVHEYVDGEEHDAALLNSGMDLEQTQILNKETGESVY